MDKEYLRLVFRTEKGTKVGINVYSPKNDLTETQINTVMDLIIAKNIFVTKDGRFVEKESAQIITVAASEFEVA